MSQGNAKGRDREDEATVELRKEVENLKQDLASLGAAGAAVAREKVSRAGSAARGAYADGKRAVAGFEESLEDAIRSSPIRSLLIAAGVGLIAGSLWSRK